jgi:hypothetical protein
MDDKSWLVESAKGAWPAWAKAQPAPPSVKAWCTLSIAIASVRLAGLYFVSLAFCCGRAELREGATDCEARRVGAGACHGPPRPMFLEERWSHALG